MLEKLQGDNTNQGVDWIWGDTEAPCTRGGCIPGILHSPSICSPRAVDWHNARCWESQSEHENT